MLNIVVGFILADANIIASKFIEKGYVYKVTNDGLLVFLRIN
jgi:hypothetical protein